jgi:FKBP-type peptidyl-prolyl cis-trans isomerase
MKKWLMIIPIGLLFACGDSAEEQPVEEPVVLESFEDRLGYVLGALNATSILESGPRTGELDKEMLMEGFNMNLNEDDCSDCEDVLIKFLGPYFQDFDTAHLSEGSKCVGRQNSFAFYSDMLRMGGVDKMNMDMVKTGFKHGLYKTDTLIDEAQRREMIGNFIKDLNEMAGEKMMSAAKNVPGVEVFENGIVMEVIEDGKGGMPGPTDDVEVEYILTNAFGDTVQSSYQMKIATGVNDPVALSLNGGVIPGWSFALPKMKKGGKYRIHIPWQLAYGEQQGKESLCFFIELVNYGPQGTLYTPQMPMGQPQ